MSEATNTFTNAIGTLNTNVAYNTSSIGTLNTSVASNTSSIVNLTNEISTISGGPEVYDTYSSTNDFTLLQTPITRGSFKTQNILPYTFMIVANYNAGITIVMRDEFSVAKRIRMSIIGPLAGVDTRNYNLDIINDNYLASLNDGLPLSLEIQILTSNRVVFIANGKTIQISDALTSAFSDKLPITKVAGGFYTAPFSNVVATKYNI